ncbi:hypothetical protein GCM10023219_16680 [Stakelama sediminis]|uniref:Outer membrane protein OmpA-like peptidoglycan-associated protein n=1 Tax=Stakelama sediminis TaxID=463200 RepID=A0A840YXX3_9SPHN|nr:OmpA family protein [Stakelama sediminis]MBB5718397.1 outer membrane protein OmpA-like peptidoglycan-associated protein [Stakelama sediminis]
MSLISKSSKYCLMFTLLAAPAIGSVSAQQADPALQTDSSSLKPPADSEATVYGQVPSDISDMPEGPEVDGIISARNGNQVQITTPDGTQKAVNIGDATEIKSSGGFLGLAKHKLASDALLNGLPVEVKTVEWGQQGLIASQIKLKTKDYKTAAMIRNGTDQRFAQQGAAIQQNASDTEALRGRFGDLDQYNVKATTNVNFDTGKAVLSSEAKQELCSTASQAQGMDNALLLVVGYTDSTGSQELNQKLSEKRASRVVNYLQQTCGWKPYRMLTPTGMAEADPVASNATASGKAQNRRVSVNVLVSKGLDGM